MLLEMLLGIEFHFDSFMALKVLLALLWQGKNGGKFYRLSFFQLLIVDSQFPQNAKWQNLCCLGVDFLDANLRKVKVP